MAGQTTKTAPVDSVDTAPESTKTYTVRSHRNVIKDGAVLNANQEVQLTDKDAESLGDAVYLGKARPADVIADRKAGLYRVAFERNVCADGKFHGTGYEMALEQAEARSLGDAIEPIG